MMRQFYSEYLHSSTTQYQELATNVTIEVNRGYKIIYPLTYLRSRIIQFTQGSVMVKMTLIFVNQTVVPNLTSAVQGLALSQAQGHTFLNIDTNSISASLPAAAAQNTASTTAFKANILTITVGILFTMLTRLSLVN
ncbi:hypothetical protein DPEC_G00187790 [Dallia pectoralis]|uniref:Uncharacterized protein n=1 Tax=Dallia pectoralis TaxID=75939 RepID=A0ACC2GC38_DALPE|nr:hypothetical protein DPEC_G00187790 [Dallia pectoralis]